MDFHALDVWRRRSTRGAGGCRGKQWLSPSCVIGRAARTTLLSSPPRLERAFSLYCLASQATSLQIGRALRGRTVRLVVDFIPLLV